MVEKLYESGRLPLLLRWFCLVAAFLMFALSITCLAAILVPQWFHSTGSPRACLLAAGFAFLMAVMIGSAGMFATRIYLVDSALLRVSRDWLFGTLNDDFEVSRIDRFTVSATRIGAIVSSVAYQVEVICTEPRLKETGSLEKRLSHFLGRFKINGVPMNLVEDVIILSREEAAVQLMDELNRRIASVRSG